jgi:hypothetical protein
MLYKADLDLGTNEMKVRNLRQMIILSSYFVIVDSSAGHGANKLTAAALMRHDAVLGDTDDAHPVSMDRDRCCQITRNEGRKPGLRIRIRMDPH